jgi:glyceraldehyde 3-phosphate dehydrogenase
MHGVGSMTYPAAFAGSLPTLITREAMFMADRPLRIGIMGFGLIGRHLYRLAAASDDIVIPVVSDVAAPETLHYLLGIRSRNAPLAVQLRNRHFEVERFSTRVLQAAGPEALAWDAFDVDFVIEATGKYATPEGMQAHLDSGAPRVVLSNLPTSEIDRLAVPGVNLETIDAKDRKISAGSATTCAMAYVLRALAPQVKLRACTITAIRSYSSDQALQDRAMSTPRRSRSAAENIIPNENHSPRWLERIMPGLHGRLSGTALNVPVQKGALLDTTFVMEDEDITPEQINHCFEQFAGNNPQLASTCTDPIVSSDVVGTSQSAIFDLPSTMKAGRRTVKTLTWYDVGVPQAHRILEVVRAYAAVDRGGHK